MRWRRNWFQRDELLRSIPNRNRRREFRKRGQNLGVLVLHLLDPRHGIKKVIPRSQAGCEKASALGANKRSRLRRAMLLYNQHGYSAPGGSPFNTAFDCAAAFANGDLQ